MGTCSMLPQCHKNGRGVRTRMKRATSGRTRASRAVNYTSLRTRFLYRRVCIIRRDTWGQSRSEARNGVESSVKEGENRGTY